MSDAGNSKLPSANLLLRVWRGEERLWKVYWLVAILGGWALGTLIGALVRSGFLQELLGLALLVIYAVYSGVSVWRCAFNARRPIWGYMAHTVIAVGLVYFVVALAPAVFQG
jgi:hypothetical protein